MKYPDCDIKIFQFYEKIWEFHKESLQKYYPFFDFYHWICKLFVLEHATKTFNLKDRIEKIEGFYKIEEFKILDYKAELPYKPLFYSDVRPHCLGYLKCSPFTKGLSLIYPQFDVKNFFGRVEIEQPTPKKISLGIGLVKHSMPTFSVLQFKELSYEPRFTCKNLIWSEKSIHYSKYENNLNLKFSDKKEFLSKSSCSNKSALQIRNELYKSKINIKSFYERF